MIPRIDVTFGVNFQHLTGKPWMAKTYVRLPQGWRQVFLEPRGTRRSPSQTLLDVRLSKVLRLGERGTLEFVADLLNLLNETAWTHVQSTDYYSPNFGTPVWSVEPRNLMLGVKFRF
jgi:outer membrane receptor protein involved in Fe transport